MSSKHFEIRFRDGGYWLHDVSTNGTYVNGAQYRLDAPYLLRDGDRLGIGPYVIAVEVEGRSGAQPGAARTLRSPASANGDVWGEVGEAAAPTTAARIRRPLSRSRRRTFSILQVSSRPPTRRPVRSSDGRRRLAELRPVLAPAARQSTEPPRTAAASARRNPRRSRRGP